MSRKLPLTGGCLCGGVRYERFREVLLRRKDLDPSQRVRVEHLAYLAGEMVERERLLQEARRVAEDAVLQQHMTRVSGYVEDPQTGPPFLEQFGELATVHLRHHDVGDEELEVVQFRCGQCFVRRRG